MKHEMRLHDDPFKHVKNKTKTIELRLNDEKRQLLKKYDQIEFTNTITDEKILVKIIELYKFDSFEALYQCFDPVAMGYDEDDTCDASDMDFYYPKEKQEKYGVLAIEIQVIK